MVTSIAAGARAKGLPLTEAKRRARRTKLVLTDSDGVLTDNGVYYGEQGEVLKRFSIRDGMGVERLRDAGIATGIITGEKSPSVRARAEKLRIELLYLGVKDKGAALELALRDAGVGIEQAAFIGDDVNDRVALDAVGKAGLTAAPLDAMPDVVRRVHYRCRAPGGYGAFRDFAEWILNLRGYRGADA
ncbi:MAG TPA: HAD family hydrolase [Polyangiaceae bacterium]|nr:HAD family hydrolase [Polyangiaceae bacterium]